MGKITTSLLILFNIIFFQIILIQNSEAQMGCYKTINGKKVFGGVSYCEQANCTKDKGRVWSNGQCYAIGTEPKQNQDKSNEQIKCESEQGGTFHPATGTTNSTCVCPDDSLIGSRANCKESNGEKSEVSKSVADKCSEAGGKYEVPEGRFATPPYCQCPDHNIIDLNKDEKCSGEVSQKKSPFDSIPNTTYEQCLEKWENKAQTCADEASQAKTACDQTQSKDSGVSFSKQLLSMMSQGAIQAKAGKGAAGECAGASLLGNTALNSLDMFKTTCDTEFKECKSKCDDLVQETSGNKIAEECGALLDEAIQAAATGAAGEGAEARKQKNEFNKKVSVINTLIAKGNRICNGDAAEENSTLNSMLKDTVKATQAAKICECKLTAGSGANCDNVVSPERCLPTGDLYGQAVCSQYASCDLGSVNYNTVVCQCQRNPSLGVCKTADPTTLSSFANTDLKPSPSSGSVDFGSSGGVGSGSDLNLGGYNAAKPTSSDTDATGAAKNAGLTASGGGGGGGGGSAPSNADGGAAGPSEPGAESEGKNSGLFGALKSVLGLGGGSKSSGTNGKLSNDLNGNKINPDKWKPRGVASIPCQNSQMRCKNETIFDVMGERFRKLESTFITTPSN